METLIGSAPRDWRHVRLGDVAEVLAGPSGAAVRGARDVAFGVPIIAPRNIRDNLIVSDELHRIEEAVARRWARYRLAENDVVCVRTGELGRQALIGPASTGWLFNGSCLRIRSQEMVTSRYLLYYLSHPAVRDWILRNAMGSTVPSLSSETLRSLPVLMPPLDAQHAIGDVLGALDEKVAVHDQISRTTAQLRDSLLSLLLTGSVQPRR